MPVKVLLWFVLLALGLAGSGYLAFHNRHVGDLRAAAQVVARWDSADPARQPEQRQLAALPDLAQRMIDSQCHKEGGGNPFARHNCYAEAAEWMLEEAREQQPRRDVGQIGMVVFALLAGASVLVRRNAKKRERALLQ